MILVGLLTRAARVHLLTRVVPCVLGPLRAKLGHDGGKLADQLGGRGEGDGGALLGGFIGSAVFNVGLDSFWSLQTWIVAILGALLVLVIWGFVTKNRRA